MAGDWCRVVYVGVWGRVSVYTHAVGYAKWSDADLGCGELGWNFSAWDGMWWLRMLGLGKIGLTALLDDVVRAYTCWSHWGCCGAVFHTWC
jgi:hypothetical protein